MEALFRALRCNDPAATRVDTEQYNPRSSIAVKLGKALLGNTHVQEINLCLTKLTGSSEEDEVDEDQYSLLFRFLRDSSSLRTVILTVYKGTNFLKQQDQFLHAISANANVEKVSLRGCSFQTCDALCHLLRTMTSLKTMEWHCCDFLSSIEDLAKDFGANHTIEEFVLYRVEANVVHGILRSAGSLQSNIRRVKLESGNFARRISEQEIATFIQTSPLLSQLSLKDFHFYNEMGEMEALVRAIQLKKSFDTIFLDRCFFEANATDAIVNYLQTPLSESTTIVLNELVILVRTCNSAQSPFHNSTVGKVAESILTLPSGRQGCSTIGSNLQRLRVDGFFFPQNWASCFNRLSANASLVQLRCLHAGYISKDSHRALVKCLPKLVHLRELTLSLPANVDASDIVQAMRRNGSLQSLSICHRSKMNSKKAAESVFNKAESLFVESYCQRNRILQAQLMNDHCTASDPTAPCPSDGFHIEPPPLGEKLVPMLFRCAASQVPIFAARTLLKMLITMGSGLGPSVDHKRRPTIDHVRE